MTHSRPIPSGLNSRRHPKGEKDRRESAGSCLPLSRDSRQQSTARIGANGANRGDVDRPAATYETVPATFLCYLLRKNLFEVTHAKIIA